MRTPVRAVYLPEPVTGDILCSGECSCRCDLLVRFPRNTFLGATLCHQMLDHKTRQKLYLHVWRQYIPLHRMLRREHGSTCLASWEHLVGSRWVKRDAGARWTSHLIQQGSSYALIVVCVRKSCKLESGVAPLDCCIQCPVLISKTLVTFFNWWHNDRSTSFSRSGNFSASVSFFSKKETIYHLRCWGKAPFSCFPALGPPERKGLLSQPLSPTGACLRTFQAIQFSDSAEQP